MTPTNHDKPPDLYLALANLGVVVIIMAMAIVGMLRLVDHFLPSVGDIVAFDHTKRASPGSEARITVRPAGAASAAACVLDVRTMWQGGGSLVIEAMRFRPSISYRVHWAGGPTSEGPTNCGSVAELLLDQSDLVTLKLMGGS